MGRISKVWLTNHSTRGYVLVVLSIESPNKEDMPHITQLSFPSPKVGEGPIHTTTIGVFNEKDLIAIYEAIDSFLNGR